MALFPGLTSNNFIVHGSTVEPVYSFPTSSAYNCMDLSPYPQTTATCYLSGTTTLSSSNLLAMTVNANGLNISISASGDTGVFKWDSVTNGAWIGLGSIAVQDWVLTDVYNSNFNDYFWQVSAITNISSSLTIYKIKFASGTATDLQDVLCTDSSAAKASIALRTY